MTTTKLYASGLITASGGLTTGNSIYTGILGTTSTATIGGALTASSTILASGLITATSGITVSGTTATFTTYTPQCSIESTIDTELTNKAYVDKNMVSYTGNGLSMYFNIIGTISSPIVNPMTSPITYELNPIMYPVLASPSATYFTLQTTGSGTKTLIASFITSQFNSSFEIQEGIWSMVLYGAVSSSTGTATYSFKIRKTDSSGQQDAGTIGSESSSTIDVNALSSVAPGMYQCSTRIPSNSSITNNRIKVEIYATVPSGVTLYTYFGGIYSSYMKTTLPITTTNNTWLGTNTFSGGITTTTLNTSGLIKASHTDGITTTKLYASGLITASHADGITTTQLYSTGTVTFGGDTAPRCDVNPLWNNELANKNYVDTSIDNYTGNGLRMYFIIPVSFNPNPITASSTYELNPTIPINSSYWIFTTGTGTKVLLASFVTEVYSVNTTFPHGWWSMVIYHYANVDSGISYYTFTLNQANNVGAIVGDQIGNESVEAQNNNSTSGYLPFRCSHLFDSFTIPANTRLRLNLYINVPIGVTATTGFGDHGSYIQTPLPITSAPNTWTGKNTFSGGLTTTTLNASGLITASHTNGITTTKLHSVGTITTQSTISASGLITASHTDGITTTNLYASGLITASHTDGITTTNLYASGGITASGGIGSTHIYYTSIPTTNIYSIGYRTTKTVSGGITTSGTTNNVSSILTFTGGSAGAMIGVWLYDLKFMKTALAPTAFYLISSIKVGSGTVVPTGNFLAGHDSVDRVQSGQIAATHDGSNASTINLMATKYIDSNANNVHVLVSTNIASITITAALTSITCTVTRLA